MQHVAEIAVHQFLEKVASGEASFSEKTAKRVADDVKDAVKRQFLANICMRPWIRRLQKNKMLKKRPRRAPAAAAEPKQQQLCVKTNSTNSKNLKISLNMN